MGTGSLTIIPVADDSVTRRPSAVERIRRRLGDDLPRLVAVVAVGRFRSDRKGYGFEIEGLDSLEPLADDEPWPLPDDCCTQ